MYENKIKLIERLEKKPRAIKIASEIENYKRRISSVLDKRIIESIFKEQKQK